MKRIIRIPTTMSKPENIVEIKIVGSDKSIKLNDKLTVVNIEDLDTAILAMGFIIRSIKKI
jgi:hypothetical protein